VESLKSFSKNKGFSGIIKVVDNIEIENLSLKELVELHTGSLTNALVRVRLPAGCGN